MTSGRREAASLVVLGLIIALGWFTYAPALSGALYFDDYPNLRELADVEDGTSALLFIFSGTAGPIGRPIALASFAAQADVWGSPPAPFFAVNILIHLANGCLLAWVLYRLSSWGRIPEERKWLAVLSATAIWLFMPLLASASLLIVQRMTTLSATFVLLGLGGYLHARRHLDRAPGRSLVLMSLALVVGTGLATLTKENGALLPVYALVLEATLLSRPAWADRRWKVWKAVFLQLPTVILVGYVVTWLPYAPEIVLHRDFTGWERLLTEAGILWRYVFNAFMPQPGAFGPFHDGYPVARTILDPLTMASIAGWLLLAVAAIVGRRRYPLAAFAVLWFLGGHVLESTFIPLELYFEHRNYLPIAGPVFALSAAAARLQHPRRWLAYAGILAYASVNALVLFTHTSLWGDPPAAARYWHEHFPHSMRAATTAAPYRLDAEGLQGTQQALHSIVRENPTAGYVKIPELSLACVTAPGADHSATIATLHRALRSTEFNLTVATMLSELFTTATRVNCNGVDSNTVRALAETLLQNPRYAVNPKHRELHHQLMARTLRHEGKYDEALIHLETAMAIRASAELNMMIVSTYVDAGKLQEARIFIEQARSNAPWHPFKRYVWLTRLDQLSGYVDAIHRNRIGDE